MGIGGWGVSLQPGRKKEAGTARASFCKQSVTPSHPICVTLGLMGRSPPIRSTSENGGCKSLPSGCRICLGQAKVTTQMDSLWLMQSNEMH